MSLTNCPDCGNERSDQNGSVCPKCGHVIGLEKEVHKRSDKFEKKKERLQKDLKTHSVLGVLGLVLWAIFGLTAVSQYEDVGPNWKISLFICIAGGFMFAACIKKQSELKKDLQNHLDDE